MEIILGLILIVCLSDVALTDSHGENAVSYTKETFDQAVAKEEILFIMFYAPWCGHCKRLAPTWDDLAKEYNVEDRKFTVGKVDCTKEKDLCGEQLVRGYPTVKWFHKSSIGIKYGRSRTIEDFKAYIEDTLSLGDALDPLKADGEALRKTQEKPEEEAKQKTEEVVQEMQAEAAVKDGLYELNDDTFDAHIAKGQHFIKFFAPWCGHCKRLAPAWEQLAKSMESISEVNIGKIDCTVHRKSCQKFNIRGYPTLLWITDGQETENYRGMRSLEELAKYVKSMDKSGDEAKKSEDGTVPDALQDEPEIGVVSLTDNDFKDSVSEDFTLVVFDTDSTRSEAMLPTLEKLAERFDDKIEMLVATVDCKECPETCKNQEANGPYPEYKMYHDGAAIDSYRGEKTVIALGTYVNSMMKQFGRKRDEL